MTRLQPSPARGNTLLVTLIVIAGLLVLVMGAIQFTGTNRRASLSKARGDRLQACAIAARQHLLSRLSIFGVQANAGGFVNFEQMSMDASVPDDPTPEEQTRMLTAHFGDTLPQMTVVAVEAASVSGTKRDIRDITNTLPVASTTGATYRVVVKCMEPIPAGASASFVPGETELEFQFRYGGL